MAPAAAICCARHAPADFPLTTTSISPFANAPVGVDVEVDVDVDVLADRLQPIDPTKSAAIRIPRVMRPRIANPMPPSPRSQLHDLPAPAAVSSVDLRGCGARRLGGILSVQAPGGRGVVGGGVGRARAR